MSLFSRLFSAATVAVVLLVSFSAFSAEAIFGPEFNFSNALMHRQVMESGGATVNVPAVAEERAKFAERVRVKCVACVLTPTTDKYGAERTIVTHPDGWRFYISVDPGVVEVQVDPMTVAEIEKANPEIQRLIFDTAAEGGLKSRDAGGHVHIGVKKAFAGSPLLFRNFLADWFTNSAVAFNLFGANETNAPTVDRIGAGSLENLKQIFKLFDESEIWRRAAESSIVSKIQEKIQRLRRKLIGQSIEETFSATPKGFEMKYLAVAILDYVYFQTASRFRPTEKYQNQNLTRMRNAQDEQTVELRSVREMMSAGDYLAWARLLQGRINYLETKKSPVAFDGVYQPAGQRESVQAFYEYAADAGLQWSDVSGLMLPWYQKITPKFRAGACVDIFSVAGAF